MFGVDSEVTCVVRCPDKIARVIPVHAEQVQQMRCDVAALMRRGKGEVEESKVLQAEWLCFGAGSDTCM